MRFKETNNGRQNFKQDLCEFPKDEEENVQR